MSVALAGRAPATFEIKSANLPLVALLLKSPDLAQLGAELKERFGDIPDFFDGDPLLVDLSPLQGEGDVDFALLKSLLAQFRLTALAVKGGSEAQMRVAFAQGFVDASDAGVRSAHHPPAKAEDEAPRVEAAPAAAEPPPAPIVQVPSQSLVIDKPLRSGQQVYARGRDIVVLAMVNPGAEVIADGNVHVYAPLRGKAIAGARGNAEARIFTLSLDPELVSIAGVYRTSETPLPATLRGKPAQIHLTGDKLVMQALRT